MNKYYKNMILCGELDYHCLLCEESFETIPDLEKHIRWEQHRRSIKHYNNVPKYKESIHKIGDNYYCEICNLVVKYKALQKHLKSVDHKEHKSNPVNVSKTTVLAERIQSSSIKFPNMIINRLQWQGIDDMKCVLCNVTIENANNHINTTKHIIKIIQSTIIENANYYFRKIAEDIYYCFGCTNITIEDHLSKHKCQEVNKKQKSIASKSKKNIEPLGLLKLIADVEKDRYHINIKEKTAICKFCNASLDVTINALLKHSQQSHAETIKYVKVEDHGKRRSLLAKYGRLNFIKLNKGGSKGYCCLCDIYVPAHMKVTLEHVNGLRHTGFLELKGLKACKKHSLPGCRAQALQNFLTDMFHVEPLKVTCINFSICVDVLSFMLIIKVDNNQDTKSKCFCCDELFQWSELNEHLKSRKHKNALAAVDVLLIDGEFLRVIRPGLFHCGFCNQVFPFWDTMGKHIGSWAHSIAKKKNELACTVALQWYTEQETNEALTCLDELYQQYMELGILK